MLKSLQKSSRPVSVGQGGLQQRGACVGRHAAWCGPALVLHSQPVACTALVKQGAVTEGAGVSARLPQAEPCASSSARVHPPQPWSAQRPAQQVSETQPPLTWPTMAGKALATTLAALALAAAPLNPSAAQAAQHTSAASGAPSTSYLHTALTPASLHTHFMFSHSSGDDLLDPLHTHHWHLGQSSLHSPPLLSMGLQMPLWIQLVALGVVNVLGVQAILGLIKKVQDKSEPVTLVRIQLGLVTEGNESVGKARIRSRLAELAGMIQVGQQGLWIILEEALLEFAKYQKTCALADVTAVQMTSKDEAYALFSEVAALEGKKARAEQAQAHPEGEGECEAKWDEPDQGKQGGGLLQWLLGRPEESGCDDALVVTLVVATRGHITVPTTVGTWSELCSSMKSLGGLSSDRLMAVDLTWTPSSEGDFLTREVLLRDYGNLKPIKH